MLVHTDRLYKAGVEGGKPGEIGAVQISIRVTDRGE